MIYHIDRRYAQCFEILKEAVATNTSIGDELQNIVNVRDEDRQTAIHDYSSTLLERGANNGMKNESGEVKIHEYVIHKKGIFHLS